MRHKPYSADEAPSHHFKPYRGPVWSERDYGCAVCGVAKDQHGTPAVDCRALTPGPTDDKEPMTDTPTRERRAPVQANRQLAKPRGTVAWHEHVEAWTEYHRRYRNSQTAERIAERHGFCYGELVEFLGHEPKTWEPA